MHQNIYTESRAQKELQAHFERMYSKQNIRKIVRRELAAAPELVNGAIELAVTQIEHWMNKPSYPQKEESMRFLKASGIDLHDLVIDIMTETLSTRGAMTMTSVCGQCAHLLPFPDYLTNVKRMADIIVIMARADIFDVKPAKSSEGLSILVFNRFGLDAKTSEIIQRTKFMPPMVCKPRVLKNNFDSAYLIHKAGPFSRKAVPHDGDICLDSMNSFNQTAFSLDIDFLYAVSDELKDNPDIKIDTEDREADFQRLVHSTNVVCIDLIKAGNRFYFPNFDDSRGRKYRRGYHVNPQGNSFRKAMLNFADAVPMEMPESMKDIF